jgi:CO/xanthine dehydrogenase Mo-binding subunit
MPNEAWGVGASLLRREDERHLHGRGEFVSDIKLPRTMEVAFVRSSHAHARIKGGITMALAVRNADEASRSPRRC